jgi:hypothetical protein
MIVPVLSCSNCNSVTDLADVAWADAVKYAVVRTLKEYGGAESIPSPAL